MSHDSKQENFLIKVYFPPFKWTVHGEQLVLPNLQPDTVHTTAIYSDTRTLMVFCQQIAWEKTIFRKLTDKYNYEPNKNAFQ